jgi:homopolymeric O-antigen transport system permease protein
MNSRIKKSETWDLVLTPRTSLFSFPWREIWHYRDLLGMFVKRDVVTLYKQTILGPLWFFIQPILTTVVYMVVFGGIAKISTDGVPRIVFYSAGIVLWNFFSESFTTTSKTFIENANLFGKVYFPRIIVPASKVISSLLKFIIQFLFFLSVYVYHLSIGANIHPNGTYILFVPLLVALMAGMGLGFGIIFTSLTTKYRDLVFLIQFGVQLLMYATPVIYPLSVVPDKYKVYVLMNPITPIVEAFRAAFLGVGSWSWSGLGYASIFTVVVLTAGVMIFNKVEKSFMDTV